ncbi:MAG: hypothetical protein L0332_30835 [Chloroflexi bacterium]|nr:hypothetical protein [Chloroflexota bacterium]MCI0731096.1 hypothetical protein [Chloroflexota bacterium]
MFATTNESVWELSADDRTTVKANQDYDKRTREPLDRNKAEVTYIALTGRRWANKEKWARQKQQEGKWTDVRAYDATDLAQWLSQAPTVLAWFTTEALHRALDGLHPVHIYFENWRHRTEPALSEAVVTAGRVKEVGVFHTWLRQDCGMLRVKGDTREECIVFACAAILQAEQKQREEWLAKSVVVTSPEAWHRLTQALSSINTSSLILLPAFDTFDGSLLLSRQHHLLLPNNIDASSTRFDVLLSPISRQALKEALLSLVENEDKAQRLAWSSGGKLTALQRLLGYEYELPRWVPADGDSLLTALLLAGAWDPHNPADQKTLLELSGMSSYESIERRVHDLLNAPDAPLRTLGQTIKWRSIGDAWRTLIGRVTATDLQRFKETCLRVLARYDPKYDLEVDERFYAPLRGQQLENSRELRDGLSNSLAWLSVNCTAIEAQIGAQTVEKLVRNLVHQLLNDDWKTWATFGNTLTVFAEAAPLPFLNRADAIASTNNGFSNLFRQDPKDSSLFGECAHCGLLRALEVLAWHPDYFPRVADILARLCKLDVGGMYSNRPDEVLLSIFHPFVKHTNASPEARVAVLRTIQRRHPVVGWSLLLDIMKMHGRGGIIAPNTRPEFREWELPAEFERYAYEEEVEYYQELRKLIYAELERDPAKSLDLLADRQVPVNPDLLAYIQANLSSFQQLNSTQRLEMQNVLRHRIATWTFSEKVASHNKTRVKLASSLLSSFTPSDPIVEVAWLFSYSPPLAHEYRWNSKEQQEHLTSLRKQAIYDILNRPDPLTELMRLTECAEHGRLVGWTLNALTVDLEDTLLNMDLTQEGAQRDLALGFIAARSVERGIEWLKLVVERLLYEDRRHDALEALVASPSTPEIRQFVAQQGEPLGQQYWERVGRIANISDNGDLEITVRHLINARRWDEAVRIAGHCAAEGKAQGTDEIYFEVLRAGRTITREEAKRAFDQMGQWYIARIFQRLDQAMQIDVDEIARLEVFYIDILSESERPPKFIMEQLEQSPEFFAELITLRFKAQHGPRDVELDPQEQENVWRLASIAGGIWHAWNGFPGRGLDKQERDEFLRCWCERALELCKQADREVIGHQQLGEVLCRVPPPSFDGIWPCLVAREYIERGYEEIANGLRIAKYNSRGMTSRALGEGGIQERQLARQYREDAEKLKYEWIKTAAFLLDIADAYDREAHRNDKEAEKFIDP